MSTILVTGASGFLGSHLIPALRAAGHSVICVGRDAERLRRRFPQCRIIEQDLTTPMTAIWWEPLVRDVQVIINAAGIIQEHGKNRFEAVHFESPKALFIAAERVGVGRIIQISALGADTGATTVYHQTKRAADTVVSNLSLKWVILQPSLVYGVGGRSQAFFAALASLPIIALPAGGRHTVQPVHVEDLVQGILAMVSETAPANLTLAVVGPEPVTLRDYLNALRAWLGHPPAWILSVPGALSSLAGRIGDVLKLDFLNSATLSMAERGNTADPAPFMRATGVHPRALATGLPVDGASQGERLAACLYFLTPLLRLAIGLVWVGSGIMSLFFFPWKTSQTWLFQVGIPANWTSATLVGTSLLDIGLGAATLLRWQLSSILSVQLILIVSFTLILTLRLPEWWFHPFGPVLKNLPLFVSTLILLVLERRR